MTLDADGVEANQHRVKPSDLPDGTPIRVLAWEESTALVEHDAGNGHLRRCRVRRARAAELLRQADAEHLHSFACRSHRSQRIAGQRYRDVMIARAHRGSRSRRSRTAVPRRRGSRRASVSRSGPGDDPGGSSDSDEPARGRRHSERQIGGVGA